MNLETCQKDKNLYLHKNLLKKTPQFLVTTINK